MKLLFNLSVCQPIGNVKRHGGGIYGEIVLRRILERKLPVSCCYYSNKWLNPEIKDCLTKSGITLFDISKESIDDIVKNNSFDRLYSPLMIGLDNFNACELICTLHGLRDVELPSDTFFFKYSPSTKEILKFLINKYCRSYWFNRKSKNVRNIMSCENKSFVTVSHHSEAAFKSYYPELFADKEIPVFYSPSTINERITESEYKDNKFFLMVSGCIWTKNVIRGMMAFDRLFSAGMLKDFDVVITGVKNPAMLKYKIKNPDRFIIKGYVDDHELHQLFHDAYCLVYPSLNEGFGYPPVEAMSYGVPIIASSYTSIPEVCQNAALYFNPFSIEEIMNRIILIADKERHERYSVYARERYEFISNKQKEDLDLLIDYIYHD